MASAKTEEKKKMGRPSKYDKIDKGLFEKYLQYFSTKKAIADYFEVSEDTIEKFCKREYSTTFTAVAEQKREFTRNKLKAKMVEVALGGNVTMLIFLAKNWLGMSDKPAETVDTENTDEYFDEAGL